MVAQVAKDFWHLVDIDKTKMPPAHIIHGCWGHDLIEDARVSYNDIAKMAGKDVAELIFAVSNEKGRDRNEKQDVRYYHGIRSTPYAVFVKLSDRIANVQYGIMTKSTMLDKYREEHKHFKQQLITPEYYEMFEYLDKLLEK
jgi:(p)ppGpp synthase/HD superfamily hydrolase